MTQEMTRDDAELVYSTISHDSNRPHPAQQVEMDATDAVVEQWKTNRPDDYERLLSIHEDPAHSFDFGEIWFEQPETIDQLQPRVTGWNQQEADDEEINLIRGYGNDYLDCIVDEIREMQQDTQLTPREFTAATLMSNTGIPDDIIATKMDISVGTLREMVENAEAKIDRVEGVSSLEQ